MYKFQKKDGTLENFDRNKIVNSVLKAGGANEDAEKVASAVEAWLPTAPVDKLVKFQDVHTQVLELLRGINPGAAASFAAYQKPV